MNQAKFNLNNQSGITLLIAVLIMSSIALISLAVAAFTIQEIRSSRAVLLTEPAIAAAESGGEAGLWSIKRGTVAMTNCNSGSSSTSLTNGSRVDSCKSYAGATFKLDAGVPFEFFLYDPNDNTDIDLLGYPYNFLTVVHQSGSFSVSVNIVRLDGTPVGPQPVTVVPGGSQTITIPAVSSGEEGRMRVTLQSSANATVNVTTNQGLPTFPVINSNGCSSKSNLASCSSASQEIFSRRINITVPQ